MSSPPPPKKLKPESNAKDGSLDLVDKYILQAAQDAAKWIAERKQNFPTRQRTLQRKLEQAKFKAQLPKLETTETKIHKAPPCKFFRRGKCRSGDQCKFSHEISQPGSRNAGQNHTANTLGDTRSKRNQSPTVYKRFEPPSTSSLFLKLVQTDHDKEDEILLDFIDQLYQCKYI